MVLDKNVDFGVAQVWFPVKESPYISKGPLTSYPSDPQFLHCKLMEMSLPVFLPIKIRTYKIRIRYIVQLFYM